MCTMKFLRIILNLLLSGISVLLFAMDLQQNIKAILRRLVTRRKTKTCESLLLLIDLL